MESRLLPREHVPDGAGGGLRMVQLDDVTDRPRPNIVAIDPTGVF
jgi:hypothetical protein